MLLAVLAAPAAAAEGLGDLHLSAVPRTADEAACIAAITAPPTGFPMPEAFGTCPGAASVRVIATADAFSQPSGNMSFDRQVDFRIGNGLFRKLWVATPASTGTSDRLGPHYKACGCQNCHLKDGRGHPPEGPDASAMSMALRLSVPGGRCDRDQTRPRHPAPAFPRRRTAGLRRPGAATRRTHGHRLDENTRNLSDGTRISLLGPTLSVADRRRGR